MKNMVEASQDPDDPIIAENLAQKEQLIKEHGLKRLEGARIRSGAKWMEEGEKSTSYFFSLEKTRAASQEIASLLDERGVEVNDQKKMGQIARIFYQNLYSKETHPNQIRASEQILNAMDARVNEEDFEELGRDLTLEDLTEAVKRTGRGRSPGIDGIPVEFYLEFWPTIGQQLLEVFLFLLEKGELTTSQKCGVISILHKKGDRKNLANWRPITLLNSDYKILAKVFANRLAPCLQNLVHPDQTAVRGRWIMDSIHLVQSVFQHLEKNSELPGGIIFLDQEKAFDRTDHAFMFQILRRLGFPDFFCRAANTLYKNATSMVKVNGFLSDRVQIGRGVRQGDPLSPMLFVLVIESLACHIRKNPNIRGLQLPGCDNPTVTSLYADDTAIVFGHPGELAEIEKSLTLYCEASGAKINLLKSNGIAVNQPTPPLDLRLGMCWPSPDTTIEYLGVPVGLAVNYKEEWNIVKDKLMKKAGNWKRRNLSLQGKVLIIKTALLPKLQYLAFAIPAGDPKELEKLIWGYLWNDKKGYHCSEHHFPPKISWRTRYGIPLRLSGLTSSQGLPEGIESDRSPLDRIREGTSLSSCTGKWNLGLEELLCSCFPASQKQICLIFWKECLRDWQRLWG